MDENIPIFFQDLDPDENCLNNIYSSTILSRVNTIQLTAILIHSLVSHLY